MGEHPAIVPAAAGAADVSTKSISLDDGSGERQIQMPPGSGSG
jgi:hypothetical protein